MKELAKSLIKQLHTFHGMIFPYRLALKYGIGRHGITLPIGIKKKKPNFCFFNATQLLNSDPNRFVYMEGYAVRDGLSIVIGEHAWVLDKANNYAVVDNTWDDPHTGCYLGVPFDREYVLRTILEKKTYGVLDNNPGLRTTESATFLHKESTQIPRDFMVENLIT